MLAKITLMSRGFSFVYLAENDQKEKFAIKTIRCKMGKELVNQAFKEAIMTDRFQHKNIIRIVVSSQYFCLSSI